MVERFKSRTIVGPVGVPDFSGITRGQRILASSVNKAFGSLTKFAEESLTEQRTIEAEAAAASTQLARDPHTGAPIMPDISNGFSVYDQAYRKAIINKYAIEVDQDVTRKLNELAVEHYNQPDKFALTARSYLEATNEAIHPTAKGMVARRGGDRFNQLLAGIHSEVAKQAIKDTALLEKQAITDEAMNVVKLEAGTAESRRSLDALATMMHGMSSFKGKPAAIKAEKRRWQIEAYAQTNARLMGVMGDKTERLQALAAFAAGRKGALKLPPNVTVAERNALAAQLKAQAVIYNATDAEMERLQNEGEFRKAFTFMLQQMDPAARSAMGDMDIEAMSSMGRSGIALAQFFRAELDRAGADRDRRALAIAQGHQLNAMAKLMGQEPFLPDWHVSTEEPGVDSRELARRVQIASGNFRFSELERKTVERQRNIAQRRIAAETAINFMRGEFLNQLGDTGASILAELDARLVEANPQFSDLDPEKRLPIYTSVLSRRLRDELKATQKAIADKGQVHLRDHLVQLNKHLEGVENIADILNENEAGLPQHILTRMLTASISSQSQLYAAAQRQAAREAPFLAGINSERGIILNQTAENARNIVPVIEKYMLRQHEQTPGGNTHNFEGVKWAGSQVHALAAKVGVVPEPVITMLRTGLASNDAKVLADAATVFRMYHSDTKTRLALQASMRPKEIQLLNEAMEVPDPKHLAAIAQKLELPRQEHEMMGVDSVPEALSKMNELFESVAGEATLVQNAFFQNDTELSIDGGDTILINYLKGGPTGTVPVPPEFRRQVIRYFRMHATGGITENGNEDQLETQMQHAFAAVAKSQRWHPSRFSHTVPGENTIGLAIDPPEAYFADSEGGSRYIAPAVEEIVNSRIARTDLNKKEKFRAGEMRLIPSRFVDGLPIYTAHTVKDGIFQPLLERDGDTLRIMEIDLRDAKRAREQEIWQRNVDNRRLWEENHDRIFNSVQE